MYTTKKQVDSYLDLLKAGCAKLPNNQKADNIISGVLLLNADVQPLSLLPVSTITWQAAMKSYYQGKVDIVENYSNRIIKAVNFEIPMPSVVILRRYRRRPDQARFSRRNMYFRDNFTCQYCDTQYPARVLTIDHVIPRCKGGTTSWENCTTACFKCNTHKSDQLIQPINKPIHPSWHKINNSRKYFDITIPEESWKTYLQWPDDLVTVNENIIH